jgi:hypothetical protein
MSPVARNPLIGFNSDDETKRLANILAAKMRFDNVSDLMRELLRREFKKHFTARQISELLDISVAEANSLLEGTPLPKERTTRRGEKQGASG